MLRSEIVNPNIKLLPSACRILKAISAARKGSGLRDYFKTDHICHAQYSNYIAATHNITHSPYSLTCTPHPALPTPLPSTTLLCTQLTNTKHSWQNGTRCRDGVKLLWCHSHLVWLVFEGSIPTCACFYSENFFIYTIDLGSHILFINMPFHIHMYISCAEARQLTP